MTTERNVGAVLDQLMEKVPEEEPLRAELEKIGRDIAYTPPEQMVYIWAKISRALNSSLPSRGDLIDDSWQREVVEIFEGRA